MNAKQATEQSVRALVDSQRLSRVTDKQLVSAKPLRLALQRLSEAWSDVARELAQLEQNND